MKVKTPIHVSFPLVVTTRKHWRYPLTVCMFACVVGGVPPLWRHVGTLVVLGYFRYNLYCICLSVRDISCVSSVMPDEYVANMIPRTTAHHRTERKLSFADRRTAAKIYMRAQAFQYKVTGSWQARHNEPNEASPTEGLRCPLTFPIHQPITSSRRNVRQVSLNGDEREIR